MVEEVETTVEVKVREDVARSDVCVWVVVEDGRHEGTDKGHSANEY
jgi:hypothetical protein